MVEKESNFGSRDEQYIFNISKYWLCEKCQGTH